MVLPVCARKENAEHNLLTPLLEKSKRVSHSKNCWLADCLLVTFLLRKPLEQFRSPAFQVLLQDVQGSVDANEWNK